MKDKELFEHGNNSLYLSPIRETFPPEKGYICKQEERRETDI
jgi:acyl-ACP thioesterase